MLRTFGTKAQNFVDNKYNSLESHMHECRRTSGDLEIFLTKIALMILVVIAMFTPLWFGLAVYWAIIALAGLLGIAVLATKIAVFLVLTYVLGSVQLITFLAGMGALFLILLA